MTTPTADESARILAAGLRAGEPFLYFRYGDGALECIFDQDRPFGTRGTCDGEIYSESLGTALLDSWRLAMDQPSRRVYVGDWLTASFDGLPTHVNQWAALVGPDEPNFLHFEAVLLMRESDALADFYSTVRNDRRRKLYMGPAGNAGACDLLGCEHLVTPMSGLNAEWMMATQADLMARDFDVLLYGAGMAGNVPVIRCWDRYPGRTYIHLGSALDVLFRGRTRKQQISRERAEALMGLATAA